ncbi:Amino acid transporter ANT1 [Vitis vinifera]|uniref:Amino acid transporter ANT1 n=1 Tax=Vitis vinifera TaxID=29760 RepID=A0A438HDM4_VITVI|nr:Amino acid transporter ANT1 [Vitis vinifera]
MAKVQRPLCLDPRTEHSFLHSDSWKHPCLHSGHWRAGPAFRFPCGGLACGDSRCHRYWTVHLLLHAHPSERFIPFLVLCSSSLLLSQSTTDWSFYIVMPTGAMQKTVGVRGREDVWGFGVRMSGKPGRYLTEFLIFISYCGGSVAYLKFIGQTLASVFSGMTFTSFIFCLVPIEIMLSWIRTLSALSPFTIFADVCNVAAIAMVVKEDVQVLWGSGSDIGERRALSPTIAGLPFGAGVAVFALKGSAFCGLTTVYVLFGLIGYLAYGDQTLDIATLNLPQGWSSMVVQLDYNFQAKAWEIVSIKTCLGLLTFPSAERKSKVGTSIRLHVESPWRKTFFTSK